MGCTEAREEYRQLNKAKRSYASAKKHLAVTRRRLMNPNRDPIETKREHTKAVQRYRETKKTYKEQKAEVRKNAPVSAKLERGMKNVSETMGKIGMAYMADQIFYGGAGTRATKTAIKTVGILTISAVAKARGATDIHWYDKYGRKIV